MFAALSLLLAADGPARDAEDRLKSELAPGSAMEVLLVELILVAVRRLRRLIAAEETGGDDDGLRKRRVEAEALALEGVDRTGEGPTRAGPPAAKAAAKAVAAPPPPARVELPAMPPPRPEPARAPAARPGPKPGRVRAESILREMERPAFSRPVPDLLAVTVGSTPTVGRAAFATAGT